VLPSHGGPGTVPGGLGIFPGAAARRARLKPGPGPAPKCQDSKQHNLNRPGPDSKKTMSQSLSHPSGLSPAGGPGGITSLAAKGWIADECPSH
jgi:hypothetical protein